MFAALDKDGNKIFADAEHTYTGCKCIACGGDVILKNKGKIRVPHFAHAVESNCSYGQDKDNKSEWHRHMQELFPPDTLEVRFDENDTDEVRIADVYLKETNTVIEFQNSPMDADEFEKRTLFHINHGRRVAWVFNEVGNKPDSEFGKFRYDGYHGTLGDPCHGECHFHWNHPRRKTLEYVSFLNEIRALQSEKFSICVHYGEMDTVHRIISACDDYSEVCFSVHPIVIKSDMDSEDFFQLEDYWLSFSPYKEIMDKSRTKLAEMKKEREDELNRKARALIFGRR